MKIKNLLLALLLFSAWSVQAQNPVLNLSNYLRNGMLDKAWENLNLAMAEERYTSDAKTWLLRGNLFYATFRCYDFVSGIYVGMPADSVEYFKGKPLTDFKKEKTPEGRASKWEWDLGFAVLILDGKVHSFTEPANGAYKIIASSPVDALALARDAYLEAIRIDPRYQGEQTFPTNAYQGLYIIGDGYYNTGINDFNQGDFKGAFQHFLSSHELKKVTGIREAKDTMPGFYAVRAAALYTRTLTEEGRFEEAEDVITQAKKINAKDTDLALSEADMYLKKKDYLKTKEILEEIVVQQPNNAQLYFVIGNIYDQLSKDTTYTAQEIDEYYNLTISFYKRAIEVNNNYFEALFNLGTIYNNKAVDRFNVAQRLPYGDNRYDGIIKEVDELFRLALPYLEKAHEVNELDGDPIRMLYSIYLRLRMNENATAMKKKLDALKKE